MSDKGIVFSAPLVCALFGGRKTQTRRLLKRSLPPADADFVRTWFAPPDVPTKGIPNQWAPSGLWAVQQMSGQAGGYNRYCGPLPYRPGDRLYVREAWSHTASGVWEISSARMVGRSGVIYRADGDVPGAKYWPSIHMPREFSRLWLQVTDVRVQRLQDISEEDSKAEGVQLEGTWASYRDGFSYLWDGLHAKPGERWADNPWLVAVTFDVNRGNINNA